MGIATFIRNFVTRARVVANESLGSGGWQWLASTTKTKSGQSMTKDESLQVSTVFACIRFISGSISTLPAITYRNLPDGGKERDKGTKLYRRLKFKPNRRQNAVQFWEQVLISLLMRGNCYVQKAYKFDGDVEMVTLFPDYVKKSFNDDGYPVYKYDNPHTKEKREFSDEDIIHVMAMAPDGAVGKSPLDYGMETVGAAKAAEEHAATFFANGANPSGMLRHPNKLSPEAATRLKKKFDDQYANPNKTGGTMVLEEGMEWQQITMTSEQAQFLQTRQFSVREICRWFGLQPHKVGDLEDATFSNIEEENLNTITDSLRPWMVRIEMAFLTGLFAEDEWEEYTFEFLTDALLRGSIEKRMAAYQTGIQNAVYCPDEVRAKENLNPLPNGEGKKFIRPLNFQVIGEPRPDALPKGEPKKPDDEPAKEPEEPTQEPDQNQRAAAAIILDRAIDKTVSRLFKRGKRADDTFKEQSRHDLVPAFTAALRMKGVIDQERVDSLVEAVFIELNNNPSAERKWGEWAVDQVDEIT